MSEIGEGEGLGSGVVVRGLGALRNVSGDR